MRSLINFLIRFGNILLFLILELAAFYMLGSGLTFHNIRLTKVFNSTEAAIEKKVSGANEYFSLRETNKLLSRENERLRNELERIYSDPEINVFSVTDTIYRQQYVYRQARVVNNSVNKQKNYITLDKGNLNGVHEDMAVISPDGVVGIVVEAGKTYSRAMSVLNLEFRLSARLRRNGYFGSLSWDGVSDNRLILNEIPNHVDVSVGDTVETTGFSAVFPEGIMIGTISDYDNTRGDFLDIRVRPSSEFRKLSNVYIIANLQKEDQRVLERGSQ